MNNKRAWPALRTWLAHTAGICVVALASLAPSFVLSRTFSPPPTADQTLLGISMWLLLIALLGAVFAVQQHSVVRRFALRYEMDVLAALSWWRPPFWCTCIGLLGLALPVALLEAAFSSPRPVSNFAAGASTVYMISAAVAYLFSPLWATFFLGRTRLGASITAAPDSEPRSAAAGTDRCPECGMHVEVQSCFLPPPFLGRWWAAPLIAVMLVITAQVVLSLAFQAIQGSAAPSPMPSPIGTGATTLTRSEIVAMADDHALRGILPHPEDIPASAQIHVTLMDTRYVVSTMSSLGWPMKWMRSSSVSTYTDANLTQPAHAGPYLPPTRGYWSGAHYESSKTSADGSAYTYTVIDFGAIAITLLLLFLTWHTVHIAQTLWRRGIAADRRRFGFCVRCAYRIAPPNFPPPNIPRHPPPPPTERAQPT